MQLRLLATPAEARALASHSWLLSAAVSLEGNEVFGVRRGGLSASGRGFLGVCLLPDGLGAAAEAVKKRMLGALLQLDSVLFICLKQVDQHQQQQHKKQGCHLNTGAVTLKSSQQCMPSDM
jgi:hypothetical protein